MSVINDVHSSEDFVLPDDTKQRLLQESFSGGIVIIIVKWWRWWRHYTGVKQCCYFVNKTWKYVINVLYTKLVRPYKIGAYWIFWYNMDIDAFLSKSCSLNTLVKYYKCFQKIYEDIIGFTTSPLMLFFYIYMKKQT